MVDGIPGSHDSVIERVAPSEAAGFHALLQAGDVGAEAVERVFRRAATCSGVSCSNVMPGM